MASRRTLLARRYWERQRLYHERLKQMKGVQAYWSARTSMKQEAIDYYIGVGGTLPEKLMFSILEKKGIDFEYGFYLGDIPFTDNKVEHSRPDFIIPSVGVIIEVTGVYWHTRRGAWEYDYQRTLFLRALGFKVYQIIDTDIVNRGNQVLDDIPELRDYKGDIGTGTIHNVGDTRAGVTALRRKWHPKVYTRMRYNKDVEERWKAMRSKVSRVRTEYALFTHEQMTQEYIDAYEQYGREWIDYMENLRSFFDSYRQAIFMYPELWYYFNRWRSWLERLYAIGHTPSGKIIKRIIPKGA